MKIEKPDDAVSAIEKLFDIADMIKKALSEDVIECAHDVDDLIRIETMFEMVAECSDLAMTEWIFVPEFIKVVQFGEFNKPIDKNSKDPKFTIMKSINEFYTNILIANINSLIKVSRTWKIYDYRGANFQRDVIETMEPILAFYSNRLETINEYISNCLTRN